MKDLNQQGKQIKSDLKAGSQDTRGNAPKQPGAYNPQQKQPLNKTTQQPLPGKGQNIGGTQGGGAGIVNKDKGFGTGKVDFNKDKSDKGGSWK
jgi:hypothetical protein